MLRGYCCTNCVFGSLQVRVQYCTSNDKTIGQHIFQQLSQNLQVPPVDDTDTGELNNEMTIGTEFGVRNQTTVTNQLVVKYWWQDYSNGSNLAVALGDGTFMSHLLKEYHFQTMVIHGSNPGPTSAFLASATHSFSENLFYMDFFCLLKISPFSMTVNGWQNKSSRCSSSETW